MEIFREQVTSTSAEPISSSEFSVADGHLKIPDDDENSNLPLHETGNISDHIVQNNADHDTPADSFDKKMMEPLRFTGQIRSSRSEI